MHPNLPQLNYPEFQPKLKKEDGKTWIFDPSRKKYYILTPEEWVRQNCIHYLNQHLNYPLSLLAVEKGIQLNNVQLRYDIVAYSRNGKPLLLVECKAPEVKITQNTFDQIAVYNLKLEVPYLLVTNGMQHFCCQTDPENARYVFLETIPMYSSL